jgi:hypothetical protein
MGKIHAGITAKKSLMMILVTMSVIVLDSSIVKFIAFGNTELPSYMNFGIFVTFSLLFVVIGVMLKRSAKNMDPNLGLKKETVEKYSYFSITITQYFLIAIMVIIIIQVSVYHSYSIITLWAAFYISHLSSMGFLIVLTILMLKWLRSKKNRILLLYAISFSLVAGTMAISLGYANHQLSYSMPIIKPYSIHQSLLNIPLSSISNTFGITLDFITIISFLTVWIASVTLLNTYRRAIGKLRYWIIVSIPLVYFLFPFDIYFLNVLRPLMDSSPVIFMIINVTFFSATKQVGGILFSMVFLLTSTKINRAMLKRSLFVTAIGVAVLFGSLEIGTLLYAVYPPFGLVTISFMPIGSYLVLNGIFASATNVSRDSMLRRELYKSAERQLNILGTIGVTQMERDLLKKFRSMEKAAVMTERTEEDYSEDEDVRDIVRDVLQELRSRKSGQEKR